MISLPMKRTALILILCWVSLIAFPKNPIIPSRGINDPHIRIIDGKACLSATRGTDGRFTLRTMEGPAGCTPFN